MLLFTELNSEVKMKPEVGVIRQHQEEKISPY